MANQENSSFDIWTLIAAERYAKEHGGGGGGGTTYHDELNNRHKNDQHPISAITNLEDTLNKFKYANLHIKKLEDYLYFGEFNNLDYTKAREWFRSHPITNSACSVVYKDGYVVRNLDWLYSETAGFIGITSKTEGRHASVWTSAVLADLTIEEVEKHKWNDLYDILPFLADSGINDAGVFIAELVVPTDKGETVGTNPSALDCHMSMVPRYILDNAASVEEAIGLLNNANIYNTGSELHYILADESGAYGIEYVDNFIYEFPEFPNIPAMTNFYLADWDGEIVTGFETEGGIDPSDTTLSAHASGLERYQTILDAYEDLSKDSAMELAQSLNFTKAYADGSNMYSEYVNRSLGLNIYRNKSIFASTMAAAASQFINRSRDESSIFYGTWQTVHSVVYDISERKLQLRCQEGETDWYANLEGMIIKQEEFSDGLKYIAEVQHDPATLKQSDIDVSEEVSEIIRDRSMDLLWENPNLASTFSEQDVSIPDISHYSYILIIYEAFPTHLDWGSSQPFGFIPAVIGSRPCVNNIVSSQVSSKYYFGFHRRDAFIKSNTLIHFGTGQGLSTNATTITTDNELMVPNKIYGIK